MPRVADDRLIVGFDTSDDACVYKVRDDLAVVQTVDFFPPVVDDPYLFGQIAAANALSDVYAMGGAPSIAMNLFCFPACLDASIPKAILAGGADKVAEAGAVIAGGHSIDDETVKYGLCVTGFLHPDDVITNGAAQEGDVLVLTKPLGTGLLTTAIKAGLLGVEEADAVGRLMATLNRGARDAMVAIGANACTDVTGFGLLGHAGEMADASGLTVAIDLAALPLLPRAKDMALEGIVPGGTYRNFDYLKARIDAAPHVAQWQIDLACDPQTAGGLLIALPEKRAGELLRRLEGQTPCAAVVGQLLARKDAAIQLR